MFFLSVTAYFLSSTEMKCCFSVVLLLVFEWRTMTFGFYLYLCNAVDRGVTALPRYAMSTKITYIHHSCFVWEGPRTMVVFDYWCDTEDRRLQRMLGATQKQIYFVVSHFHQDHFNPVIFEWGRATAEPPRLLISHDVSKRRRVPKSVPVTVLRPGDHYEDRLLTLDAYRSTDVGISSVVTLKDVAEGETADSAFHAGDLNNWYFPEGDERLHVLVHEMEGLFLSTVRDIQLDHPHVTHAMFPLDPRLDKEWLRGPAQWLTRIETDHFYPMHTWGYHDKVRQGVEELAYLFPHTQFHYNADPQADKLYGTYRQIVDEKRQEDNEQLEENDIS